MDITIKNKLEEAKYEMVDYFSSQFGTHDTVYHYTTITCLKSIIDNKQLWMTDTRYLNDYTEIVDGLKLFISCFEKYSKSKFYNYVQNTEYQKNILLLLPTHMYRTFVFSLSGACDSKPHWAEYGDMAKGVSVGFSAKEIFYRLMGKEITVKLNQNKKIDRYNEKVIFGKIIYDDNIKKDIMNKYIEKIVTITENADCINLEELYKDVFVEMLYLIISILPLFKNKKFCDENEYRLVVRFPYRTLEKTIAKIDGLKYRVAMEKLIPYYQLNLDDIGLYITEVIIGPKYNDRLAEDTIQEYLGLYKLKNIKIIKSGIPIQ